MSIVYALGLALKYNNNNNGTFSGNLQYCLGITTSASISCHTIIITLLWSEVFLVLSASAP